MNKQKVQGITEGYRAETRRIGRQRGGRVENKAKWEWSKREKWWVRAWQRDRREGKEKVKKKKEKCLGKKIGLDWIGLDWVEGAQEGTGLSSGLFCSFFFILCWKMYLTFG